MYLTLYSIKMHGGNKIYLLSVMNGIILLKYINKIFDLY